MNTKKIGLYFLVSMFAVAVQAQGNGNPTAEQRKTMAEMHSKMAACLSSDRTFDECRSEMHSGCEQTGSEWCGMGPGRAMMMRGGGPRAFKKQAPKAEEKKTETK